TRFTRRGWRRSACKATTRRMSKASSAFSACRLACRRHCARRLRSLSRRSPGPEQSPVKDLHMKLASRWHHPCVLGVLRVKMLAMTEKMWSGRFREPLDPGFDRWQRSFFFDRRLLPDEIAASRAWASALGEARVLSREEVRAVRDVLALIGEKAADNPGWLDSVDAEDVHHFVEMQLVAIVGDVGYKLHTGRSRNEQIATDLRLFTRRSLDAIRAQLAQFVDALISQAEAHGDAPMASYTHMQRAEPVLTAHWLLAYAEMFLRDAERLADCRRRVNVLPLGSGAVAGPGLRLNREMIA